MSVFGTQKSPETTCLMAPSALCGMGEGVGVDGTGKAEELHVFQDMGLIYNTRDTETA